MAKRKHPPECIMEIFKEDNMPVIYIKFDSNRVARFLTVHAGTRLVGYLLEQTKDETLTRPLAYYRLQRDGLEPAMEAAK